MNKVILIGKLGKDPELRQTPNGFTVVTLQIATNERGKDKEGKPIKLTEWHRCEVWGKQAELCTQYLFKGDSVCLEGKLRTRAWEEKGGTKKYITEILVQSIEFLPRSQKEPQEEKQKQNEALLKQAKDIFGQESDGDDLPF